MKQSGKGILKKSQQLDMKKELHWDEQTLQQQDLERGNKMKITEPKTPYEDEPQNPEKDIEVEDEIEQDLIEAQINKQKLQQQQKLDIEELNKRLQQDLERERKQMDRDSDDEQEKKKKHEDFIKKRKQHYNEKNVIRAALHKKLEDN